MKKILIMFLSLMFFTVNVNAQDIQTGSVLGNNVNNKQFSKQDWIIDESEEGIWILREYINPTSESVYIPSWIEDNGV